MKRTRQVYWLMLALSLLASGYYALRYRREQAWVGHKAQEIVEESRAETRRQQIVALRTYVRQHVRYEGVAIDGRPFLRDSAQETLESEKGYCGEATRAFICLADSLGIKGKRVNLLGRVNHVVAEAEIRPGKWILVDVQDNTQTNPYLDSQDRTLEEILAPGNSQSPFQDYSNVNLRRVPGINRFVQRIKLHASPMTWVLENPALMKSSAWAGLAVLMVLLFALDRALRRVYAYRFGITLRAEPLPLRGKGEQLGETRNGTTTSMPFADPHGVRP